jgi:hypothetical protein
VQHGDVHREPARDRADAVVEHRVAGDPQRDAVGAGAAEREADHVADDRPAEPRPVPARRRRDLERAAVRRRDPGRLPRRETARPVAEAAGTRGRRHDGPGGRQQRSSRHIEVVVVVVVGQEHRVDAAEAGGGDRGA